MRRKDRELKSLPEIEEVLRRCEVCRLGLCDGGFAYIVPMNYGFTMEDGVLTLYFHCAREGRKLELLRADPRASFELDGGHQLLPAADPARTSFAYECVMGTGAVEIVEDPAEKKRGLDLLMAHYGGAGEYTYTEGCMGAAMVLRLVSRDFTGKRQRKPAPGFPELLRRARGVVRPRTLSDSADAGGVGAALLTGDGNVYTGVCVDTSSSMGFCAEHAAAAAMITAGESRVVKLVAVDWEGRVLPPCGRCREFISQLHPENRGAEVLVREDTAVRLGDLLPFHWQE